MFYSKKTSCYEKKVVENISANSLKNSPRFQSVLKSGTCFILSFTQLIQRGRLADLKNTPSKSRDLYQNKNTKKNVQKIKKNKETFQNHSLCPRTTPTLSREPFHSILLCFMTFVHQLQLLSPFAAWGAAVLLELRPGKVTRVMARSWHGWRRSLPEKNINSSPLKIMGAPWEPRRFQVRFWFGQTDVRCIGSFFVVSLLVGFLLTSWLWSPDLSWVNGYVPSKWGGFSSPAPSIPRDPTPQACNPSRCPTPSRYGESLGGP